MKHRILKITFICISLIIIVYVCYCNSTAAKMNEFGSLVINKAEKEEYISGDIAIFGTMKGKKSQNIDCVTVLKINDDKRKIDVVSVDYYYFRYNTHSYKALIKKINSSKKFNIKNYITVNAEDLLYITNKGDGIPVDIAKEGVEEFNDNLKRVAKETGTKEYTTLNSGGSYRLDGIQSTAFAFTYNEGDDNHNTWHFRLVIWGIMNNFVNCSAHDYAMLFDGKTDLKTDMTRETFASLCSTLSDYKLNNYGSYNIETKKIEYDI